MSKNKEKKVESLKEEGVTYLENSNLKTTVNLEQYSELIEDTLIDKAVAEKFANVDIEKLLDEIDKEIANPNTKYLTHEEVFSRIRRIINGE